MLTRDQILSKRELQRERVSVPEWGGEVIVSEMTGRDRDAWEAESYAGGKRSFLQNARARLAAFCIVDEQGTRIFSSEDVEQLGSLSWIGLNRVVTVAQRLNKLTDKDLEEVKGNS